MKKIELTVYEYNELSPLAQKKAVDTHIEENLNLCWWEPIYERWEQDEVTINSFNLDKWEVDFEPTEGLSEEEKEFNKREILLELSAEYEHITSEEGAIEFFDYCGTTFFENGDVHEYG